MDENALKNSRNYRRKLNLFRKLKRKYIGMFGTRGFPSGQYFRWYIGPTVNMAARMHQKWFYKRVLGLIEKRNYPTNCGIMSFNNCRSPEVYGSGNDPGELYEILLVFKPCAQA